jgi:hypothetical protein
MKAGNLRRYNIHTNFKFIDNPYNASEVNTRRITEATSSTAYLLTVQKLETWF